MDVRHIRPLFLPPYPRRNRYIPVYTRIELRVSILINRSALLGFWILNTEGLDSDLFHYLRDPGLVVVIRAHFTDLIHNFNTLDELSEGGILSVKMGRILVHHEKLTSGGIGSHGTRHGEYTAVVLEVIFKAIGGKFTLYAVARTADAYALGVASLDHKAGNDAVENNTVIKAFFNKGNKIVNGIGCNFGIELSFHDVARLHFNGNYGIAH